MICETVKVGSFLNLSQYLINAICNHVLDFHRKHVSLKCFYNLFLAMIILTKSIHQPRDQIRTSKVENVSFNSVLSIKLCLVRSREFTFSALTFGLIVEQLTHFSNFFFSIEAFYVGKFAGIHQNQYCCCSYLEIN